MLKAADFDMIIIETVGVGQTEIEIAGIADLTVVVLVPEAGDDIQNMKAGLMEIADIFVVNKADRPGAEKFLVNLKSNFQNNSETPVLLTVAAENKGINELTSEIDSYFQKEKHKIKYGYNLAEKTLRLIVREKMRGISRQQIMEEISIQGDQFNLFQYVHKKCNQL